MSAVVTSINPRGSIWSKLQKPIDSEFSLDSPSSRYALFASIGLHLLLGFLLMWAPSSSRPVLVNESRNEPGQQLPLVTPLPSQPEIVKAVSVNSDEVKAVVNRLKEERLQKHQAEAAHQQQLRQQAEQARAQRMLEEQRIAKLKDDAEKIAIAHQKQVEEEKQHLKQLAVEKEQEAKRLAALKQEQEVVKKDLLQKELLQKKQQEEAKKQVALQQKAAQDKALAAKKAEEQAKLAAAEAAKRQQAAAQQAEQARIEAANQARMAGEVDKYKAMIIDAIGRQWILPENVNQGLSSQFRIRLAPDGGVLEVSLIRSSGDPILDRSAQTAIYKASPLPVPSDSAMFNVFREISLTVRPENVRG